MYKASVNGKQFDIESNEEGFWLDGEPVAWDLTEITKGYFHIIHEQKTYRAELVKVDHASKTFTIKINGKVCQVQLKDRFDLLLEKMGMSHAGGTKVNHVKAPMPGLIIDLKVNAGDTVHAGQPLLILEAMKMENIIKAAGDAVVKTVKIKKGDSVEKNQVLIEF